ncbi:izumo sperm-egg fusion protein 1-like isoform X1 [Panthera tigris]|uniref:izumo sperm-egg fusion protein 1-like isoform X1 n=1 Tax=Panthera tigris TaxID=9694 RepID=UPI001C6F8071|nr:izumo sperm-egg fusion protein 1-like isoform X1 [Panthera tigris]
MGPQVALLVAALAGCLLLARSCITCDERVVKQLDALEKEYLRTHLAPGWQREVMEKIRDTVDSFKDLPDIQSTFNGAVDEATMKMAASSFLKSMKLITNRGLRDDTFVKEFSAMLTREKETFRRDVARFHGGEDSCPNKCGVLLRLLRWCDSCLLHTYPCRKSTDCGVRQINVHEKEDLVLDCELDWHKIATGATGYSFYRVWGSKADSLLYMGKWPTLTKQLVRPADAGTYRCALGTPGVSLFSAIRFEVTVLPRKIISAMVTSSKSATIGAQSPTIGTQSPTTGTQSPTTGTQSPTIGMQSPAIRTEAEEEIWDDLSPTLEPSECSKPENVQTGRLIGLLLWCFFLLIIGFFTGVLCFRSGMVIDSIKSRFHTDKAAAPQDQLPQGWLSQSQLSHDQLSQSPLSETQVPKAEKLPEE